MLGCSQVRIDRDDRFRPRSRTLEQLGVFRQARDLELAKPGLACPHQLALLAQAEVDLGETNPSPCSTIARSFTEPADVGGPARKQLASMLAASHPAPQLMQLGDARTAPRSRAIITVALGTSIPTSITVVATSTSASTRCEGGHRLLLLAGAHPPVEQHERMSLELPLPSDARAPPWPRAG